MKIRLFKDEPPLCFNLEKWGINNIPILLVTGLSGSGKTTFAKKYALQHKAVCISFDVLKFYPQSSIESQQILNLFLKQYPDIQQFIDIQWSKTDKQNSNDIFFNYYCNVFFDFIVEYSKKNNIKVILEGIQMYVRLHPSKSAGLPLIIIRNSCLHSFCNKLRSLINSYREVDKTDVRVNFVNYSDSSLDIEVFFYADIVPLAEYFDFKTKFNCDVKALAESMNIDFAFDSRSLYFANELKIKNNEK